MQIEPMILELIRKAYEAGADPSRWPDFLSAYMGAVGGTATALVLHDLHDWQANIAHYVGFDPAWQQPYEQYYAGLNVWIKNAPEMFVAGKVGASHQVLNDSCLKKTEFCNDYLAPQDYFYSFGGTLRSDKRAISYLTAMRPYRAGEFSAGEIEVLETLMPHLDCALKVHAKLVGLERRVLSANSALDAFPCGVLLLDSRAQLLFMNRAAETLLNGHDGLGWLRGELVASDRVVAARLNTLIAAALQTAAREGISPGARLSIPRPSLRRPFELMVTPLPKAARAGLESHASVAVFLTDPELQQVPDADALRQLYGLTAAEARMAAALVQGRSTDEAAEAFGISVNTARTQVKSILAKTQTRRQSDLVRLLMSGLARLQFRGS